MSTPNLSIFNSQPGPSLDEIIMAHLNGDHDGTSDFDDDVETNPRGTNDGVPVAIPADQVPTRPMRVVQLKPTKKEEE